MAYSGRAEQIFHKALLQAFDRVTLEQFVTTELEIELENVTRPGNVSNVVWDLLRWADRTDRTAELIEKAAAEVPGNPQLQLALKHVRDPELIEDRWFAKFIPLTTWLIGVLNVALIAAVIKVWFVNLIDIGRWLAIVALAIIPAYVLWRLYQRLAGGPGSALAMKMLVRRLRAHSRLAPRDWATFGGALAATAGLSILAWGAPSPIEARYVYPDAGEFKSNYILIHSFENDPEHMKLQGPPRHPRLGDAERFKCGYYQVDFYRGRLNGGGRLTLRIELATDGVAFADLAFDRSLDEEVRKAAVIDETHLELPAVPSGMLNGRHAVVFTIQYVTDAQPSPNEVAVHASISNADQDRHDEWQRFALAQWPRQPC